MLQNDKIKIDEIVFVNHLIGNAKGSHTEFKTDRMYHYQLLYKLCGEAEITFDRKKVIEKADDIRFLPSNLSFKKPPYYSSTVIEQGESINIGFTTSSPLPQEIIVKSYRSSPLLKKLFMKMQKHWYYKHNGYYHHCLSVLYEILAVIGESEAKYISSKSYNLILPALDYIDLHFTECDIDCKMLAKICNISQVYMNKLFKETFGMTPIRYITSKKLQYACDLFAAEHDTISEVSEKVGFSNTYYFSKVFKNHMGVSPSKYRARG